MQFFFENIVIYSFSYALVIIHNSCFGLEVNIPFLQKEFAGRIQAVKEEEDNSSIDCFYKKPFWDFVSSKEEIDLVTITYHIACFD